MSEQKYCTGIGCDIMLASYQGTHCDACFEVFKNTECTMGVGSAPSTPSEKLAAISDEDFNLYATAPIRSPINHIMWMEAQPKTLNMNHARCGLAQLSHIAVLLETYGTLLIRNCAIQDNPGSMLLGQGMQIGQARDHWREENKHLLCKPAPPEEFAQ